MYQPYEYFLGLRYTRSRKRTSSLSFVAILSIASIAIGIAALITVMSVMNGFHKEVRERILGMASHATVTAFDGNLVEWQKALDTASQNPDVVAAAPYVELEVMLVNGQTVSGAVVRGVDPTFEDKVADIEKHMQNDIHLADLVEGDFGIILGAELASSLRLVVGDKVTMVTPHSMVTPVGTMPRLKRFTVLGTFQVGMGEYDSGVALVSIHDAAKVAGLEEGVTGVRLKVSDLFEAKQISREVALQLPNIYLISDWTSQHRNFFQALQMEKRMVNLLLVLIVIVAAFSVIANMIMVVKEKFSDIAILKTLGASSKSVIKIFFIQGFYISSIGIVIGVVSGILLALFIDDLVAMIEKIFSIHFIDPDLYYISKLPSDLHWLDVFGAALIALLFTLPAALLPARWAAKIQPAEALRYE